LRRVIITAVVVVLSALLVAAYCSGWLSWLFPGMRTVIEVNEREKIETTHGPQEW
jgi:hypothetical protein